MIEQQQILAAFDEHMDKFKWRMRETESAIEVEAYRQLVDSLSSKANNLSHQIERMEAVFKALNINPREHIAWIKI